jgi:two-component system OmpR family response regulator
MNPLPDILLVEDSKDDRDLFELALQRSDLLATVSFAATVGDALKRLNRQPPYDHRPLPVVAVVDLALPDLNGVALLRYLRSSILPVRIPVVVLTGSLRAQDRANCESLQIDDYLVKPELFTDLVAFIASLHRYLPGGTAADATVRLFRRR